MTELESLKTLLAEKNIRPNRALGQNFLADAGVLDAIADAAAIDDADVLEIGPGLGALTKRLLCRAGRVVAVEKDAFLAEQLRLRLPEKKLTVVTADALKLDPGAHFSKDWHAVGNLPYYITTPLAERYLLLSPASLTFLVQREAAERFFAAPGDRVYGPLAILTQIFYSPERVLDVPRSAFYPEPEVDSAVVHLAPKSKMEKAPAKSLLPEPFFRFLNRAFAMRRKTLVNNFKDVPNFRDALMSLGLDPAVRAEALPPETLRALYLTIAETQSGQVR